MEEKTLNPQESLEVITRMIKNTQEKWQRNAGKPSLIWGYTTIVVSLTIWVLYSLFGVTTSNIQLLWLAIPVIGCLLMMTSKKGEKGYKTIIDEVIKYIWITLGTITALVSLATFIFKSIPVLFIVVLLISIGSILTGLVSKLKVYVVTGIISVALSFLCFIVKPIDSCLIFAALFVLNSVIPGHVLNSISNKLAK